MYTDKMCFNNASVRHYLLTYLLTKNINAYMNAIKKLIACEL